ncbi:transcriptional regulator, LysR family [Citreicella sp. SE45]|nr:transcriptional regulator, LysR family [Citreicella sp. SE45]
MISRNLRHLRLFLAACELGSLTRASEVARVTRPAVTQAQGLLPDLLRAAAARYGRR